MTPVRKRNATLRAGIALVSVLCAAALAGTYVHAPTPTARDLAQALESPSARHWLGCDAFGSDLARQLLAGAYQSLSIATLVTGVNLAAGLLVGTAAAVARPWLATLLTRLIDCFLAFPGLLLAILLASIMPRSEHTVVLALALTGWTSRARFCRTLARSTAHEPYVEAAAASGAGLSRIVTRHLWPAMLGQLAVQGALSMGYVIMAEASLSFLGLGGGVNNASWGRLIAEGREYLVEAPHLSVFPGCAFLLAVVAFNLLAEGLRQHLTPSQASL